MNYFSSKCTFNCSKVFLSCYLICLLSFVFVVESVKLLGSEVNNTIHHPSALGVEASHVMPGKYCIK